MTIHTLARQAGSAPFQAPKTASLADIAAFVGPPDFAALQPSPLCAAGYITIYLAGSPVLAEMARKLGIYLLKIGATTQSSQARISSLVQDQYAGLWGKEGYLNEVTRPRPLCANHLRFPACS